MDDEMDVKVTVAKEDEAVEDEVVEEAVEAAAVEDAVETCCAAVEAAEVETCCAAVEAAEVSCCAPVEAAAEEAVTDDSAVVVFAGVAEPVVDEGLQRRIAAAAELSRKKAQAVQGSTVSNC